MAKLTAEMSNFIKKERDPVTVFVGTSSKDGIPNIAAKGTFISILDDETLAYADTYSVKTLKNVRQNPHVVIAVINAKTYKGYQFKGMAEVVESGPILEEARKQNPQVSSVTKVKVKEIYLLDYGPQAGKKVA
ncbi:MAG: pyridoxamine 5-phosphate oxidase-related protein, FMN-binding [Dehalococcoidia bacterium]|nr:pyridoxamine 5-phosphate oxidase-related protein, FMN-binding [Dehalococcoidia bacterium]